MPRDTRTSRWGTSAFSSTTGKFKHTYRLCVIITTIPSDENIVRTVKVGFRPRRQCCPGPYKSVALDELVVGVPRLVLIVPKEELPKPLVSQVLHLTQTPALHPQFSQSCGGGAVAEELGNQKQDQSHAMVCVNSQHLMPADFEL